MRNPTSACLTLAALVLTGTSATPAAAAHAGAVAFALQPAGGPTTLAIANAGTGQELFEQQMPGSQNGDTNLTVMVASSLTKLVYATLEGVGYGEVVAIDPRTGNASNFFTLPNGDSAWQLALGDKGATLYVVGGANSYAVNAATGALEKTGPSIEGVPPLGYHELAASPTQPLLFTAFGSGYTVSSAKTFHYLYQVQVGVQPIAFAVSPNGKFLYTAQYDENAYIIDIANQRVRHAIPLGTVPNDLVADAATDRLYVATPFGLTVISTKSAAIVGYVSGIGTAANLAVDPATHACFAATGTGLWSIDPQTLAATQLYTSASETVQGVSQTY